MMGGRQAGVCGRLAGALKALVIPELREHERSGRRPDTRDRFLLADYSVVASEKDSAYDWSAV
jgi:hypothetical protein